MGKRDNQAQGGVNPPKKGRIAQKKPAAKKAAKSKEVARDAASSSTGQSRSRSQQGASSMPNSSTTGQTELTTINLTENSHSGLNSLTFTDMSASVVDQSVQPGTSTGGETPQGTQPPQSVEKIFKDPNGKTYKTTPEGLMYLDKSIPAWVCLQPAP